MDDDTYARITFRMPRNLHTKVSEVAEANNRSMNAEIVARLEQSLSETVRERETGGTLLAEISRLLDDRDGKLLSELKAFLKNRLGNE